MPIFGSANSKGIVTVVFFATFFFIENLHFFLFSIPSGSLTFYNSERHIYPFELYDEKVCVCVCVREKERERETEREGGREREIRINVLFNVNCCAGISY